jgi:diaminohydroxyphosphoribosylaminopyrimidine deaminase/5-amino-6-(5-phosphoribosylamino)uracil reductase
MSAADRARVTLKLATSLDGKIALANGESQWITGPESRAEVHRIRAGHDAILTGIGTILSDDPKLTARPDGGCVRQPDVIIMDSQQRTPPCAKVHACPDRQVHQFAHGDLEAAMRFHDRVMIEAGGRIAASAIRHDLVDRIEWFRAPKLLGGDGLSVLSDLGLDQLSLAPTFKRIALVERGDDLQESYERIR